MRPLRVYVDTSVIGGCFDLEFELWSVGLMEDFRSGLYVAVLSDVTAAEVRAAPPQVRDLHASLIRERAEVVSVSEAALDLVELYEERRVLSPRYRNDMLHIAIAIVAEVDVLVSWNFAHIVRLDKIRLFNAIGLELGYREVAIRSPREVTSHGRQD